MYRYALLLLLLPASPLALAAQVSTSFTPYVAVDQSLSTQPVLAGASLSASLGPVAIRGSGSLAHASWQLHDSASAAAKEKVRAIAGDVDIVLNPGRAAGAAGTFGALEPRVFAGYGVRGEALPSGAMRTHNVVSIGTIMSYSVLSRVRFDVEARRLAPARDPARLFEGTNGAWEYRAGLAFHFGKGALRPSPGILRLPGAGSSGARRGGTVVTPAAGTLLATADRQVGIPYVWGGDSPDEGFDCSGFVQHVFAAHGVRLPRTSREMAQVGQPVPGGFESLRAGDLMFFAQEGGRISHVALYAGDNMMVHSSRSGGGVGYDDLTTSRGQWYRRIYVGSQRVLGVPIEGVTLAGSTREQPARGQARGIPAGRPGTPGAGIRAFLKAAGMTELSAAAKRLYGPDEIPDGPDGAPVRRW